MSEKGYNISKDKNWKKIFLKKKEVRAEHL